jgi:8-oxo-dGTP pyrophosphatase MutT (NUDIX family)
MLVRSAGVVLFRPVKKREYLLLHYAAGHWDLPKGIIEKGEASEQAALRELKEETGISKAEIISGFKETIKFTYAWEGKKVLKFVVFFLARTRQKRVEISWEHRGFVWLPYKEAVKKVTFRNAKNVLKKAEAWLNEQE